MSEINKDDIDYDKLAEALNQTHTNRAVKTGSSIVKVCLIIFLIWFVIAVIAVVIVLITHT